MLLQTCSLEGRAGLAGGELSGRRVRRGCERGPTTWVLHCGMWVHSEVRALLRSRSVSIGGSCSARIPSLCELWDPSRQHRGICRILLPTRHLLSFSMCGIMCRSLVPVLGSWWGLRAPCAIMGVRICVCAGAGACACTGLVFSVCLYLVFCSNLGPTLVPSVLRVPHVSYRLCCRFSSLLQYY